jgi:hypothetical protein
MNPARRFWQSRGPEVLAVMWLVWSVARLGMVLPSRALNFDFNHYYTSSWLARQGISPYRADLIEASRQLGFVATETIPNATNPPPLLWLVAPLTWLAPAPAFAVWTALLAIEWGWLLWLTLDLLGTRLTARGRIFCIAYFAAATAVFCNFYFGHIELLLAVLVLAGYRCLGRGQGGWAVTLVTLAGVLKLFPFGLLPWFVWRGAPDFRTRLGYAGLALGIIGVTVPVTGWGLWRDFAESGLAVVSGLAIGCSFNFSLASFTGNVFLVVRQWVGADWPRTWAQVIAGLSGAAALGGAYIYMGWNRRGREAEFCLLSVALLLASLTAWGFYFVLLLFPVVGLATRLVTRRQWLWFVAGVLMVEVMQTQSGGMLAESAGLRVLANYFPLYGAVIIGGLWLTAEDET